MTSLGSVWDGFASGIERASKRQFDDEPGGGALDPDTWIPGVTAPGSDADVPVDEGMATVPESERSGGFPTRVLGSFARQFDDNPGGGFLDEVGEQATGAAVDAPVWIQGLMTVVLLAAIAISLGQLFTFNVGVGSNG
jgi:hypothetical protein